MCVPYPFSIYLLPTTIPSFIGALLGIVCSIIFIVDSINNNNEWYQTAAFSLTFPVLYLFSGVCIWSSIYTPIYFYIQSEYKYTSILYTSYTMELLFIIITYMAWFYYIRPIHVLATNAITIVVTLFLGVCFPFWGFIASKGINILLHYYQASLIVSSIMIIILLIISIIYSVKEYRNKYTKVQDTTKV
jgi:hypothetical protein